MEGSWTRGLVLAALIALPGAPALAQPFPPSPPDRRETVAGWRVVHVYDEDDGRDVGMSVRRAGVRIDYFVNYWRGNGRPFRRVAIQRAGENCHSDEWQDPHPPRAFPPEPDVAGDGRRLRARLIAYLAECGIAGRQAEQALAGFAPAFARLAAFAEQARRHTEAVNCSIEHYPDGEATVRRLCHRR